MNHRTNFAIALAAATIISACGASDDSPLRAGEINLNGAGEGSRNESRSDGGEGAVNPGIADPEPGAPAYCHSIAKMRDDDLSEQEALVVVIEFLDGVAKDGPSELRSEVKGLADSFRTLNEIGVEKAATSLSDLTDQELEDFLDAASNLETMETIGNELLPAFRQDCGADFIDSMPDGFMSPQPGTAPDTSSNIGTVPIGSNANSSGEPFEESVAGPFGTGQFGNIDFEITAVEWSNRPPIQFLDKAAPIQVVDADRRFVYLTVDLLNTDPNDRLYVDVEHLTILVEDGSPIAGAEVYDGLGGVLFLEPAASQSRVFGFEVGQVLPADQLTLRFADNAIPGFISIVGGQEANPYPISIDPPTPGEFIGNAIAACDVTYTWSVDTATVLTEVPKEYDSPANYVNARAEVGKRWLQLEGFISTGSGVDCDGVGSGVVDSSMLRLVIDGRPVGPVEAPFELLGEQETVEVNTLWEIPADVEELAIKALGRDGDSFESPFTVPSLPSLRGE